jgi:hypothetical protein
MVTISLVVFVVVTMLVRVGCGLKIKLVERMRRSKEFESVAPAQLRQAIFIQLPHVFLLAFFEVVTSLRVPAARAFTLPHLD